MDDPSHEEGSENEYYARGELIINSGNGEDDGRAMTSQTAFLPSCLALVWYMERIMRHA